MLKTELKFENRTQINKMDQQRHLLYEEYIRDLEMIKCIPFDETYEEQWCICQGYLERYHYTWIDIYCDDIIAGFLIIGITPDCHPDCDYSICQSFVKREYRGKGLMTAAINDFIDAHSLDKYSFVIHDNNAAALRFWRKRFTEIGFHRFPVRNAGTCRSGERVYAFAR